MFAPARRALVVMILIALAPQAPGEGSTANAAEQADIGGITDASGGVEVLVAYVPTASSQERVRARSKASVELLARITAGDGERGPIERVVVKGGSDLQRVINDLALDPAVRYAEPNYVVRVIPNSKAKKDVTFTPAPILSSASDPYYRSGETWGVRGGNGSGADTSWATTPKEAPTVFVGVLDEGVQLTHEDLAGRAWTNPSDSTFDGVDNDGNGKVDDVHGWDFHNDDSTVYDGQDGSDLDSHGTQVAGVMVASHNNVGLAGVASNVGLITAKFIGPTGGTTADAVRAFDYFTELRTRSLNPVNVVAVNNSWQGGEYSEALREAIARAARAGILIVAAAGNNGRSNDGRPAYPANYQTPEAGFDAVLSVAALDELGELTPTSQYGRQSVELAAPGSRVLTTSPGNKYYSVDGTSLAAPFVTGAIARYSQERPSASAAQLRERVMTTVTPTPSLQKKTTTGGRLNMTAMFGQGSETEVHFRKVGP